MIHAKGAPSEQFLQKNIFYSFLNCDLNYVVFNSGQPLRAVFPPNFFITQKISNIFKNSFQHLLELLKPYKTLQKWPLLQKYLYFFLLFGSFRPYFELKLKCNAIWFHFLWIIIYLPIWKYFFLVLTSKN